MHLLDMLGILVGMALSWHLYGWIRDAFLKVQKLVRREPVAKKAIDLKYECAPGTVIFQYEESTTAFGIQIWAPRETAKFFPVFGTWAGAVMRDFHMLNGGREGLRRLVGTPFRFTDFGLNTPIPKTPDKADRLSELSWALLVAYDNLTEYGIGREERAQIAIYTTVFLARAGAFGLIHDGEIEAFIRHYTTKEEPHAEAGV